MEKSPVAAIESMVADMLQGVHTCIPGKIESFDADKCLAVVTPTGQFLAPGGKKLDYPKIYDVPVYIIQYFGQKCTIAFPIKEGDGCMLHFAEQQLDQFRDGEEAKCDLRFDLTNAVAVVGLCAEANSVVKDACDDEAIIIDHSDKSDGNTRVTIKKNEMVCKVGDDAKVTITEQDIVSQVGDSSKTTITSNKQECVVGGATFTIESGKITAKASKIKMDGDLEVTGKVTAQQTIDATGNITSSAKVEGKAGVSGASADLDTHTHDCTAPGSPSGPPLPG